MIAVRKPALNAKINGARKVANENGVFADPSFTKQVCICPNLRALFLVEVPGLLALGSQRDNAAGWFALKLLRGSLACSCLRYRPLKDKGYGQGTSLLYFW